MQASVSLFSEFTGERDSDLGFSDLETESETSLLASAFDEQAVSLSPDGRWMVYGSDSSGRYEVVVRPFPSAESRVQSFQDAFLTFWDTS